MLPNGIFPGNFTGSFFRRQRRCAKNSRQQQESEG
jgi:hypothetical protein